MAPHLLQAAAQADQCKSKLNERIHKVSFNLDFSELSYSVLDDRTYSFKYEYEYLPRHTHYTIIIRNEPDCSNWLLDRLQVTKR